MKYRKIFKIPDNVKCGLEDVWLNAAISEFLSRGKTKEYPMPSVRGFISFEMLDEHTVVGWYDSQHHFTIPEDIDVYASGGKKEDPPKKGKNEKVSGWEAEKAKMGAASKHGIKG